MIRLLFIDSRIQDINQVAAGGRCRGCRAFPTALPPTPTGDHTWTPDHSLVAELADQVRRNAAGEAPAWAAQPHAPVPAELIADMQVWRAATQVDPSDLRPTGPPQLGHAARVWQQQLDKRLAAADTHADRQWRQLLATEVPSATADPFLPELEERLTNLTRAGFDATHLRAVGGRRRTPTRRPPRRSPLVAHPRPATANAEPGTRNPRRSPSDQAHGHDLTRPAATRAALGAASRVRPEPLKPRHPNHQDAGDVLR